MRFQDASLMLKPRNPCPVCEVETVLAEIEPTLCTSILRFTDISATDAVPSNPWLCFTRRLLRFYARHPTYTSWASSSLSKSCPKNGDVPKFPFPTVAAVVPSAGTISL
jgi:hypothetical protein